MENMFSGCKSLSFPPNIPKLDISKVTNMCCMFKDCLSLPLLLDISKLENNSVNTRHILQGCINIVKIPPKFKEYYVIMGPKFIYAFSCKEADIKREWSKLKSNEGVKNQVDVEIYKIFEVGKRYTKADIKETLKGLYNKLGYQKTAKASDLEQYFKVKGISKNLN
jgi:hypothetical protein